MHHGGAGTTTPAVHAGAAQVVIPQHYDQPYWAERVNQLGIGVAHSRGVPTVDSLTDALKRALEPSVRPVAGAPGRSVRDRAACLGDPWRGCRPASGPG
ncbi:glycosyltransferase [Allokutzneria albata]|uniref:glycosyltransferase n=1 Tax=Allokutzneria albata TaxID=211114 RepID=UPI0038990E8F